MGTVYCTLTTTEQAVVGTDGEGFTIETVVLGPFRVWHIAGISIMLATIVITVICCVVDVRIPRSRQAIEKSHHQRAQHGQKLFQQAINVIELREISKVASAARTAAASRNANTTSTDTRAPRDNTRKHVTQNLHQPIHAHRETTRENM